MTRSDFKKRSGAVLIILMIWGGLAAAHVIYYSCWKRCRLLEESLHLAWREGEIPAMRGRILTPDGIPLAWSELTHDLYRLKPARSGKNDVVLPLLREFFGEPLEAEEKDAYILLKRGISPDQILRLRPLLRRFPELEIRPRPYRRNTDASALQAEIGKTEYRPELKRETGISGWEEKYDRKLAGTPGIFRVMLDRDGAWVPGTIEILAPPVPGKDVTLSPEVCKP